MDNREKALALVDAINATTATGDQALVFCTVVDPEIRQIINNCNGFVIDFFDAFIQPLENELGTKSTRVVGKTHGVTDFAQYKTRIDAINYALNNDDGLSTQTYAGADIIIIGVSRCGKTPTSLYLAVNYGVFAANYPLTEEDLENSRLPNALVEHHSKLFGLSIDAHRLQQIRQERRPNSRYAKLSQCNHEVNSALAMYKKNAIPFADTSHTSIEEIAAIIMHHSEMPARL